MAGRFVLACVVVFGVEQALARRQKAGLKAQVRANLQSVQEGAIEEEDLFAEQRSKQGVNQTWGWVPKWVPFVPRRRTTTPIPVNPDDPLDGHGFCCCKDEPCKIDAVSDTKAVDAVYSPNQNTCCKMKKKKCSVWTQNWFSGYKNTPPTEDYCNPSLSMDVRFAAATQVGGDTTTTPPPDSYTPGTPGHTVHTYCNFSQHVDIGNGDDDADAAARHRIVTQVVDELSDNSIDAMAKSMFTVYLCVRWAPSSEFVAMLSNEMATDQLADRGIFEHYEDFTFMPMRCSENMKVYDQTRGTLNQTFFEQFEADMASQKNWLTEEGEGAFTARLKGLSEARKEGHQDKVEELSKAFDLTYVRQRSSCDDPNSGKILVNAFSATAEQLLSDCAGAKWWETKLVDWQRSMPFSTFMSPQNDISKDAKPEPQEQVMLCFGKRVASQLHRRTDGDHLMTDQTTVGCHGFYTFDLAAKMVDRIIRLWRPPTCQLAAMELDFKVKILEMMADMNDRLFDAIPSLLMEEESDMMNFDGTKMDPAGPLGVVAGMWKSIVSRFDFFKKKSSRLGTLLGDTVVKWVVCPLNSIHDQETLDALDSSLGTEDQVARYYNRIANARHTGETELLPGERCEADRLPNLPRAQTCSLGKMRENMPEPYADEHFLCPILPLLPAKQQVEVFKKKEGMCVLHQTLAQLSGNHWYFRGHTPSQKQYNATEMAPSGDFKAVKIVSERSHPDHRFNIYRTFVKYAVGCTEAERESTPRWCTTPEIYNDGIADRNLLTSIPIPGSGSDDGIANEGAEGLMRRFERWAYGSIKGIEGWARRVQTEWFGRASKRYNKFYDQSFLETEVAELLHAISYQRHEGDSGGDSTGRDTYDRYVVTVPCSTFEPDREFELKYDWQEYGLQFLRIAREQTLPVDQPALAFDLRGEVSLHARDESNVWLRFWSSYRVRAIDQVSAEWKKTDNPMFSALSGALNPPAASKLKKEHFKGFTATFACGTRRAMHDAAVDGLTLEDPNLQQVFETCVREGATTNAQIKKDNPDVSVSDDQVVVRMTIHELVDCEQHYSGEWAYDNETLNHAFSNFVEQMEGCSEMNADSLSAPVQEAKRQDTFRGALSGQGMPMNTLKEVLIDPADVVSEAFQ